MLKTLAALLLIVLGVGRLGAESTSENYAIEADQQTLGSDRTASANYDCTADLATGTAEKSRQGSSNYEVIQVAAPDANAVPADWSLYE